MKKVIINILYWIIQCTWGSIMTLIGAVAALGVLVTGHKPHLINQMIYFEVGNNWGGANLGGFAIVAKDCGENTKLHEYGHSLQNLILGPFMPFIVCIPSALRYWYFNYQEPQKKEKIAINITGAILLGLILFALACFYFFPNSVFLFVLSISLLIYWGIIIAWTFFIELPKETSDAVIKYTYDSIWFEHYATVWGLKSQRKKEG